MSVRSPSPPGIRAEHETEKSAPSSPRHSLENSSEQESNADEDGAFAPIACPATHEGHATQRRRSNASSRALERSWSLNDGVSIGGDDLGQEDGEAGDGQSGYVVGWEENDVMNPRNMNKARKWMIVIIVSMGSLCVTCTSSMYTTTYSQLMKEFDCSQEIATLGLSFFIWGLGIGPLFLSPLSEFYGRRNIYIVSFSLFLIWLIPCAVAKNIQTMIVCRFFNGLAGSAFLSVAGGTVGDLFDRHELAFPMMLYTASPFIGPEVGPLVGGFINDFTTWRWTFYVLLIWTGILLVSIVFLVPETYHPVYVFP